MKAYIVRGGEVIHQPDARKAQIGDFYTWGRDPKIVSKCVSTNTKIHGQTFSPSFKAATPEEIEHVLNIIKTHELLFS